MRGIIILDGPDGAGKTTLADSIKSRALALGSKAVVHHLGAPEEGTAWRLHLDAIIAYIQEAFDQDTVVIADRHFMSEGIYGDVYRKGSEYPIAMRHIDRLLHRFRALRVICAPPVEHVKETFERLKGEREEMYNDSMDKIATRYLHLWSAHPNPTSLPGKDYLQQLAFNGGTYDTAGWYHYDVTTHGKDLREYSSFLLHELDEEQDLLPEDLLDIHKWNFTGFPHEHAVLLVGDKMSSKNALNIPFLSNEASSLFLARTLQTICADESKIVMANVNDLGGTSTVRGLSELCGRVIVLGREAERTMRQYGLPYHACVRHPQHASRFNHHDSSYAWELYDAMSKMASVKEPWTVNKGVRV